MLYEFCAENFERVPAAIDAGAKRIELCDNLAVGGTTPSAGVISATVSYAHEHDARVMCMIRPRGGDFHYNQDELRMMEMDLGLAVSAGADGLVFGCCKPCAGGWALDELTLGALVMAAGCATEECKRYSLGTDLNDYLQNESGYSPVFGLFAGSKWEIIHSRLLAGTWGRSLCAGTLGHSLSRFCSVVRVGI